MLGMAVSAREFSKAGFRVLLFDEFKTAHFLKGCGISSPKLFGCTSDCYNCHIQIISSSRKQAAAMGERKRLVIMLSIGQNACSGS
jgi:hypothetical protein